MSWRPHLGELGGVDGNAILTSVVAAALTLLLAAEGVTILDMRGLRTPHMVIGLVLIPPVLVKLGSTGYRFTRYYAGSRAYREKGPPWLPMRLTAPLLVLTTIGLFATGVALLLLGHRSGSLVEAHKIFFIVWAVCFVAHLLGHLSEVLRSMRWDWTAARRSEVPGAALRLTLLAGALVAGSAIAALAYSSITHWHGRM